VVDGAIAVVVETVVADFLALWVDVGIGVVAVSAFQEQPRGVLTGLVGSGLISVAIRIGVLVPDRAIRSVIVDLTAAVVVDAVSDLYRGWADLWVGILTVPTLEKPARTR
jgi:hypothetical protein